MKQAEAPPDAKWTGPSHAGVKAPEPILLADPAKRFAATAQRLERLAEGHPLEAWLRFMAELSRAQHMVATTLAPAVALDTAIVARATEARLPPLAADGHRRETAWREGLGLLLDRIDTSELPSAALEAMEQLRRSDAIALERLADH